MNPVGSREAPNLKEIPVYVINLDRRPDRWTKFSTQIATKNFNNMKRFSAVDGSKIDISNDKRISVHTKQNIENKYRRSHYEINTPGAIGASLSHITIWKTFLASEEPYCLVFEDDTVITPKMLEIAELLISKLPSKWDIWLLGHHRWSMESVPIASNPNGWRKVFGFTGAHAYIINRRAASVLLEDCFPIETHIEYYMTASAQLKNLTIIRYGSFRVPYEIEFTDEEDSDTFDTIESCPVCSIPDDYLETFIAMPKEKFYRGCIGVLALGIVLMGTYIAHKSN